ncbi:neuropeptide B [Sturnira hondurensis]|uniref:neuropeptide B n=1 Tax=Sturnira hondurensis TaxID=192404 RepID=UPI00187A041E|nr:neuropeptide B [Sturnira hondurensis]
MARLSALAAALARSLLLLPPRRRLIQAGAGPRAHSVGRASGLLSGLRGSPYAHEHPVDVGTPGRAGPAWGLRPSLRSPGLCVQDVAPDLQSRERLPDGRATFQCKADVFLSLGAANCRGACRPPCPRRPRTPRGDGARYPLPVSTVHG